MKTTAADRVVDGAVFARRTLEAGFTTVVDLGGDPDSLDAGAIGLMKPNGTWRRGLTQLARFGHRSHTGAPGSTEAQ